MGGKLEPNVIRDLRKSNVTAINLTAVRIGATYQQCVEDIQRVLDIVDRNSDDLCLVLKAQDIDAARKSGRTGVIIGMQDTNPLDTDLSRIEALWKKGVRIIQLTHNVRCAVGTGCVEEDEGLTAFGRAVVAEMDRLGIAIDTSHCGPKTTIDAADLSRNPIFSTHANPSKVCPSPRNKSDDEIRAIAAGGGVLGAAIWSPILCTDRSGRPTLSNLKACIEHLVDLVGPQHVAIGTDLCDGLSETKAAWSAVYGPEGHYPSVTDVGAWYNYDTNMVEGVEDIGKLPVLYAYLKENLGDSLYRAVSGDNFFKVLSKTMSQ